jgi:hypothetical protein
MAGGSVVALRRAGRVRGRSGRALARIPGSLGFIRILSGCAGHASRRSVRLSDRARGGSASRRTDWFDGGDARFSAGFGFDRFSHTAATPLVRARARRFPGRSQESASRRPKKKSRSWTCVAAGVRFARIFGGVWVRSAFSADVVPLALAWIERGVPALARIREQQRSIHHGSFNLAFGWSVRPWESMPMRDRPEPRCTARQAFSTRRIAE